MTTRLISNERSYITHPPAVEIAPVFVTHTIIPLQIVGYQSLHHISIIRMLMLSPFSRLVIPTRGSFASLLSDCVTGVRCVHLAMSLMTTMMWTQMWTQMCITHADSQDEDTNGFHTILTRWKQIYHRRDLIGLPYIQFKATRAVMSKTGVSVCLAGDPVLQHWLILREVFSYLQYPQPPLGEIPPKPIIGTWLFGSPLMYLTSWGHWASQ